MKTCPSKSELMSRVPTFTVFTPTYNRASTLPGVYESLLRQTFRSFEWLIVDDGSRDDTRVLVEQWQNEARIGIRYIFQPNAGKHVAHNRAVREASGELFLVLDSDDACVPEALERLHHHWERIPRVERRGYSGVSCLCMDSAGHLVGTPFPEGVMNATPLLLASRHKVRGEKWGFHRTDVLQNYPFPEFVGERFVSEGLVWNRIASEYKLSFVNETLRIYQPGPGGLVASSVRLRAINPRGACLYYQEHADYAPTLMSCARGLINFTRFALHARTRGTTAMGAPNRRLLRLLLWPVAWGMFRLDRYKMANAE